MSNEVSTESFHVETLAVSRGKGSNAMTKVDQASKNGAFMGVLIDQKVGRKAIIDQLVQQDWERFAAYVADGLYRSPMATIVAISQRPFTFTETNGLTPRADWNRLRAELQGHDSKSARKALIVWDKVQAMADEVRRIRQASKA